MVGGEEESSMPIFSELMYNCSETQLNIFYKFGLELLQTSEADTGSGFCEEGIQSNDG